LGKRGGGSSGGSGSGSGSGSGGKDAIDLTDDNFQVNYSDFAKHSYDVFSHV
jgi:hypothetical protein